jgi:hypothetical protein
MSRSYLTFVFVFALLSSTASAQSLRFSEKGSPFITVQINTNLSLPAGSDLQKQRDVQEQLRVMHYEMANTECARLSDIFKQDCRLLSVNVQAQNRGQLQDAITSSASTQFQLTPR